MNKQTIVKSLLGFGVLALLVGIGYTHAEAIARVLQPKVVVMGNYIEAQGNSAPSGEVVLGSVQNTTPSHLTGDPSNQDNTYFFGDQGIEVRNTTFLDGATNLYGTTTFSGAVVNSGSANPSGLAGVASVTGGTATTTVCSLQNTSGASRVLQKVNAFIDLAVSPGGAATSSLTYGVTSTPQGTPLAGDTINVVTFSTAATQQALVTSTVGTVIWPNNSYLVLKSSVTTTQPMNCQAIYTGF